MKLLFRSLLIFIVLLFGCKSTKDSTNTKSQKQSLEELIASKYSDKSSVVFNESQSHALVQSVARKSEVRGQSSVHFFVYDKDAEEIILEDFINKGSVEWINDKTLKVSIIPGQYKEDVSIGYTFDVAKRTREAIEFTE